MVDTLETRLTVGVHYHILDLCDKDTEDADEANATDCAGIVRAGDGVLHFIAGPHSGDIDMTVAMAAHDPGADDAYGDIVEISVRFGHAELTLVQWAGEAWFDLPALPTGPGWYRARYHVERFDEAAEADVNAEEPVGRHLVQLWPQPHRAPAATKVTSEQARYWISARPLTTGPGE